MKLIKPSFNFYILITLLFFSIKSYAVSFNLSAFYNSDSFAQSSTLTTTQLYSDFDAMIDMTKSGGFEVGWTAGLISTSESGSSSTTYSLNEMGPKFLYNLNKQKNWQLGLSYYLQANASYSNGSSYTWRGTAYKINLNYLMELSETLFIGVSINYHAATFNEQFVGGSTFSTISYTRGLIYPALQISYR
ncbi:MAG: hypothetical protein KDD50_01845 [Bdellovibrionales bacterium]|nr:hypothetical protein [Bdellovibrionales bacterium]